MNLQFVPKGIELVQQAIAADNDKNYEQAYGLYKQSLDHFLLALKYEKNKAAKEIIQKRVEGYMERAEMLKKVLQEQKDAPARRQAAAARLTAQVDGELQELKQAQARRGHQIQS